MGQGGHIRLINDTAYQWRREEQSSYQMEWEFPKSIPPYSEEKVYLEFKQTVGKTWTDDGASVKYQIESPAPSTFRVKAAVDDDEVRQLWVDWQTSCSQNALSVFPLPISGDSHLGFIHRGTVPLTVTDRPDRYLTVMSFNIDKNGRGGDGTNEEGLSGIINLFENGLIPIPDVLLLQEAYDKAPESKDDLDRLMDCLCKKCGSGTPWYKYFAAESDNWKNYIRAGGDNRDLNSKRDGNAILSRFPLQNTGVLWFDKQEGNYAGRNAVYADIKVEQQIIRVYSAHLESDPGGWFITGGTQNRQLKQLVTTVSKGSIIGGDFNIPSILPKLRWTPDVVIDTEPLCDIFKEIKGHTCHFKEVYKPDGRLDYILSGENRDVYHPTIGDAKGRSDHQPIWATFLVECKE